MRRDAVRSLEVVLVEWVGWDAAVLWIGELSGHAMVALPRRASPRGYDEMDIMGWMGGHSQGSVLSLHASVVQDALTRMSTSRL